MPHDLTEELTAARRTLADIAADQHDLAERQIVDVLRRRMLAWERRTLGVADCLEEVLRRLEQIGDAAAGIRHEQESYDPTEDGR